MTVHNIAIEGIALASAMRDAAKAHKGEALGPDARPMFDEMLAATPAVEGVLVEPGVMGGYRGTGVVRLRHAKILASFTCMAAATCWVPPWPSPTS